MLKYLSFALGGALLYVLIKKEINKMTTTLAQLDAAIAELTSTESTFVTDVQALITKLQAGEDYTAELNNVQSVISQAQTEDTAAQDELNPPAATNPAAAQ